MPTAGPSLAALAALAALATLAGAASDSCCSMTRKELISMRGTHDKCPSGTDTPMGPIVTVKKCGPCPTGNCRVKLWCFCPGDFLHVYDNDLFADGAAYMHCEESFGQKWPDSVGLEDKDWRSCAKESNRGKKTATGTGDGGKATSPDDVSTPRSSGPIASGPIADPNVQEKDDGGINWDMWGGIIGGVGVAVTVVFGIAGFVWNNKRKQDDVLPPTA